MMTSIVQESTATTTTTPTPTQTRRTTDIPPHFLLVGRKNALDYIAPALFRIGTFGELVVRAKGSMSIVTAVNVAEMVKKDVAGLETRSIAIGTEEIVIEGMPKRVSYIEIHLAKPAPVVEAPTPAAAEEAPPQDKLAETATTAKKIRAKAKKSTTTKKRTVRKQQKADA